MTGPLTYLMKLLESILKSHYFGELLKKKKREKYKPNASLIAGIYKEEDDQ
jgi:hypothetical protein